MKSIVVEHLSKVYRIETRAQRREPGGPIRRALRRAGMGSDTVRATRDVWALRDISLEVERGTVLGVIGHNGAGKTTLLKTLGRVTIPTAGRAVVRGRVVSLLGLGHGFQRELSARDNIYLNAALYGVPRQEVDRRLPEIVEFAGIGEFVDSPVGHFSSGMYLRLAFSVAVNMRPDVILADEVLAVGDIEFQERCLQRVEEAGREGVTVLFVSHDMRAIGRLCRHVIRLESGEIVDQGSPDDVVSRYESSVYEGAGEMRWGGAKLSPYLRFLSIRLTSPDGREIDAPRGSDDFLVQTTVRTLAPNLQLRFALTVSTGGMQVFQSSPGDAVTTPTPGVWSARARIPGDLLADRVYTADVTVAVIQDGEVAGIHKNNFISFRVYGSMDLDDGEVDGTKTGRRPIISPRLDWMVVREASEVPV